MIEKTIGMARRGEPLREHILYTAKDVFLTMGFERASMDLVAARAETSKRTLYAHFESKENLYLAVVELVRELFLNRLGHPGDVDEARAEIADPIEALARFCVRYQEAMLYGPSIRMLRVSVSESERFPQGASQHYDVVFTAVHLRIRGYLERAFGLSEAQADVAAERLLGRLLYPRLLRALSGLDPLRAEFASEADLDPTPVRRIVEETLTAFPPYPDL